MKLCELPDNEILTHQDIDYAIQWLLQSVLPKKEEEDKLQIVILLMFQVYGAHASE